VTIVDISGGQHHTMALDSDGHAWVWGNSYYGTLDGLQGMGYARERGREREGEEREIEIER